MKRAFWKVTLGLLSAVVIASCGSGGGSSLDPKKRMGGLTSDEQKKLCDETAELQGGYGQKKTCPDGTQGTTDVDQATCLGGLVWAIRYCPELTVGDALDCARSQAGDLCSSATDPKCQPVRDCMARIPRH
jgi:hypothetical protein